MTRAMGLLMALTVTGCEPARNWAVRMFSNEYEARDAGGGQRDGALSPIYDGADAERARIPVRLRPVADGFTAITDVQFPPGASDRMVVLEKGGKAWVMRAGAEGYGDRALLMDVNVEVASEQGLLGLAFHPGFAENGRFYVNYVAKKPDGDCTEIAEWTVADPSAEIWTTAPSRTILSVRQPYANHNAGQVIFGPDGMLYVGFGDGGWRDDPHAHGQNRRSFLGAMLRLDVDHPTDTRGYAIPADNPFIQDATYAPEAWAIGLRNPWRYSFDTNGRMIVADVGQNTYEEVDVVTAGDNLGWSVREGRHCFPPSVDGCPVPGEDGIVDPIYEYPHAEGTSITGGYVVTHPQDAALNGKYVFGDFTSGRIWALELPEEKKANPDVALVHSLGRFGMLISTFGRDADGRVYVADYQSGLVYRIEGSG
ncbi:MAG: PQQ-dependent sugar dehydrogenase [Myxococcota bacterium]